MRRNLSALGGTEHDLLVIGGGIQGACIAWDATLRGLRYFTPKSTKRSRNPAEESRS